MSGTWWRRPFVRTFFGSSKEELCGLHFLSFLLRGLKAVNLSSSSHTSRERGHSPNTSRGKGRGEIMGLFNLNRFSRIVCIFAEADFDLPGTERSKSSLSQLSTLLTLPPGETIALLAEDLLIPAFLFLGVTGASNCSGTMLRSSLRYTAGIVYFSGWQKKWWGCCIRLRFYEESVIRRNLEKF